jgi:hypothetical protein
MRRNLVGTLSLLALATLPALLPAQDRQVETNAFTWSGRIPAGRWINVRDLNGAISVERATGDRVEVTATRRWRRSDPKSVRFVVQKSGAGDQDVTVCALWGDRSSCDEHGMDSHGVRNNDVSVEFTVRVPDGVRVGVSTVNGGLTVDGVTSQVDASTVNGSVDVTTTSGPVSASTVNGSVRARMGKFTSDDDMDFTTVNGSVVAEFTGDLNADVELSTVNGRFRTDYPVTVSGKLDPRHLKARIGKGGPKLTMTTVNGNVELRQH